MAELDTIANYAEIIGAVLVVGGLAFAAYELRQAREQREREQEQGRRTAAYQLFQGMGSKEFIAGQLLLRKMPVGLSKQQIEEQYGDRVEDLVWVLSQFERLGTMVADHAVPLDLAFDFYQPTIINTWSKLKHYIIGLREESDNPFLYFYVEWMAQQVEELGKTHTAAAIAEELKDWRPR